LLDEYGDKVGQMHPIDEAMNKEDEITPAGRVKSSERDLDGLLSPKEHNLSMVSETTKQDVSNL